MKKFILLLIPLMIFAQNSTLTGDLNTCENFDIIEITENHSDYNGYGICCYGGNSGFIDITVTGGTGNYSYIWSNGEITEDLSDVGAGAYLVTVTDENDCEGSIEIIITEPELMEISEIHSNYNGYGVSCNGATDGFIDVNVTGGTGVYTFIWSNGADTEDISDLGAGVYSVTVMDENGSTISAEIGILETQIMEIAEIHSDYSSYGVSCNGEIDGFIDITITGGTGNYTYTWSNGETAEDLLNIGAGAYTVTATDENSCSVSVEVEITEPEEMIISAIHSDYSGYGVSCNGSLDGWVYTTISGGTGFYTYSWSNGETTEHIDNISAGMYSVTITDENGCSAFIEVEIIEPEEMEIAEIHSNYNGYGISCNGAIDGFIDLTVTGGTGIYTFIWSNGADTEDVSDLGAGAYTVTATDENNCSVSIEVEITETEIIEISETHSYYNGYEVSCSEATDGFINIAVIGGTGNYTYTWSNGETTEDLSNIGAGTYTVTATDENGCLSSITVEISEPSLITVNFSSNDSLNYCFGDSNGFIEWNFISGGEPFIPCEGDNNEAAIENFTLNCSELTATFDCDFTFSFDFSVGDLCPESCGYCPDLLFGYEVVIVNIDTEVEFSYNNNSLPAGNYLVRITDSINCTIEEGFVINHPEEIELDFGYDCLDNCINDSDGDEICDEFEIEGCDDDTACNYNPSLTDINNNLCDYISCADDCGVPFGDNSSCTGCTIMGFCNYCPDCTINDFDACIPFLDICSEESACNYSVVEDYYEFTNYDENCVFYCEDCCEYPPLGLDCEGNDVDVLIDEWSNNKKIIKIVDILGREINIESKDILLLYIYEDGSIEKKYVIE